MTTPRRLRYAMIGGGPGAIIGPIHRIAARLDDQWELVAGALSSDAERAAQGAMQCRIRPDRSYADWQSLIAKEAIRIHDRIDAIVIVTPNHVHADPAIAALEAGFHVICDKPLASSLGEGLAIERAVQMSNRAFILTHAYAGYPMVRQMRRMAEGGALGKVRIVQVQYAQDWLTIPRERHDNKQAVWRTDPSRSGGGGALGDIGTHAYHLANFVTGLRADALCADLDAFGDGRTLDDNVHLLLRYPDGIKGMLWASQVAPGKGNQLRIGLFGSEAGVEWDQEFPNQLRFTRFGEPSRILERGDDAMGFGGYTTRLPANHPEGFLEAFAQIYTDAAALILAKDAGRETSEIPLPGIEEGVEGMLFIQGTLVSDSRKQWVERDDWARSA